MFALAALELVQPSHPTPQVLVLAPTREIALQSRDVCRLLGAHVTLQAIESSAANVSYPINALRNAALRAVRTTHYIVLDVDLWPSAGLHAAVLSAPPLLLRRRYAALVVPAFQLDAAGEPRPELAPLLEPLLGAGMDGWRAWAWLTRPAALPRGWCPSASTDPLA